ncbi:MAG: helix-turn-helix domain-containing protein [Flavisolibacter sp.]|jgi:hypothetical protein|nr:helix-turn-helix domain-containing protein [Flavisolibacter sp.]
MHTDHSNTIFNLAFDLVNYTSRHIFLTGKAGTGKTTFLKYLKENTGKKTVIIAPTGVAAINAGGVTMHSFFQLPFGPYLPAYHNSIGSNERLTDKAGLLRNLRFSSQKRTLLNELELLIIDEVSMLRADMLDAMDAILRHTRRQPYIPFGGVQVVYIGDLYQLPPVVPSEEWELLRSIYESPFFFHAQATKEVAPLYIELKKIYRQSEQIFIDTLNRIRNNRVIDADVSLLENRFLPDFIPEGENYITLTTHNKKADLINNAALEKLSEPVYAYKADVNGDFPEKSFPAEDYLKLKRGAQVMFIKNDSGDDRKFFNGKLAIVHEIDQKQIVVAFEDGEKLKLEKETWKNNRYILNQENNEIEEDELGSFKQYPLRLAWAITIHKSQGLSFEKAIIDAGSAFAPGQVYVALSRCTSLQGMVLHSRITPSAIKTDERIIRFSNAEVDHNYLKEVLVKERKVYQVKKLLEAFRLNRIHTSFSEWEELIHLKSLPGKQEVIVHHKKLILRLDELMDVESRFIRQLEGVVNSNDAAMLEARVGKGILYFSKIVFDEFIIPIQEHLLAIQHASKISSYIKEVEGIKLRFVHYIESLNKIQIEGMQFQHFPLDLSLIKAVKPFRKGKKDKGESQLQTLALFNSGNAIKEIAQLRNLSAGTIETHLVALVATGAVSVDDLLPADKKEAILKAIVHKPGSVTAIKNELGDEFSFYEIRAVINHVQQLKAKETRSPETAH